MDINHWKILSTTYLHPNIRVDKCELPNGQIITPHLLEYDDEIMVLALTQRQEVVLIKQYRLFKSDMAHRILPYTPT